MREKKTLKTLPKTSQNNLKWSEHKLLIRKNDIDPPPYLHHHPHPTLHLLRGLSLRCLLGLTAEQHVDLLFDPVLVVRLVRLCVGAIPEAARKIILCLIFLFYSTSLFALPSAWGPEKQPGSAKEWLFLHRSLNLTFETVQTNWNITVNWRGFRQSRFHLL